MENKELKAITENSHRFLVLIIYIVSVLISFLVCEIIKNIFPDFNIEFWSLVLAFIMFIFAIILIFHFLESKEVLSATFYDEHVILKRGKRERRIPYNRIKKVVKYMIIDRTYQDKGHYRVVIRCKGRNYVMYSGEDAELKLDYELTEISKIYYEFKHRGIMCC